MARDADANNSLPLMGIGNWRVRPTISCESVSLPLMGIGNLRAADALRAAEDYDSLPLMGIGNGEPDTLDMLGCTLLITPHGDRERAIRRKCIGHAGDLITPHGDREL